MKSKKRNSFILLVLTIFLLVGCKDSDIDIDLDDFTGRALGELDFEDQLEEVDLDMAKNIYGIDRAKAASIFISSGATAEELAIFEFESEEEARSSEEELNNRIEDQKMVFESYNPEELVKLKKAEIGSIGKYSYIIVSKDEKIGEFIKEYK